MCGIAGLFDTRAKQTFPRELMQRMNDIQLHRGPDESGYHFEPGVALAHRRLSIIDISSGQQPLFNEDESVVVVFNGEIYNFQELIPELTALGHRFHIRGADLLSGQRQQAVRHDVPQVALRCHLLHVLQGFC